MVFNFVWTHVSCFLSFSDVTFVPPNRFTCMGFLLLSKGCIPGPHDFASVSGLASHSGCLGPHEFTPVFHLSFTLVCHFGCLGPHEFTVHTCLPHLSRTLGALGRMSLHLSSICLPHLSPTLGALGRMSLHLSPTCLPHLSPTLGALGRMSLHLSSTCLSHLSPTLGALGRMSLHLSRLSLTLWVPWAA